MTYISPGLKRVIDLRNQEIANKNTDDREKVEAEWKTGVPTSRLRGVAHRKSLAIAEHIPDLETQEQLNPIDDEPSFQEQTDIHRERVTEYQRTYQRRQENPEPVRLCSMCQKPVRPHNKKGIHMVCERASHTGADVILSPDRVLELRANALDRRAGVLREEATKLRAAARRLKDANADD